jgi:hypothetical protein
MAAILFGAALVIAASGSTELRWESSAAGVHGAVELSYDDSGGMGPRSWPEPREDDPRDRVLESRIALLREVSCLRLAATATAVTSLRSGVETALGYSAALSFPVSTLAIGIELLGGVGDTKAFLIEPPGHSLAPAVAWMFLPAWSLRADAPVVLATGEKLVRLHLAYEF